MKNIPSTPKDATDLLEQLALSYSHLNAAISCGWLTPESHTALLNVKQDLSRETGKVVRDILSKFPFLESKVSSLGLDAEDAQLPKSLGTVFPEEK